MGDWAVQYLDYSKLKHSPKTYEEKQRAFRSFFKSVDRFLAVDLLHKRTVLAHLSEQARSRSGYAANKERKNFVAAWNWATQYISGFPAQNPFLVERFSEDRTVRYVPTEAIFDDTHTEDRNGDQGRTIPRRRYQHTQKVLHAAWNS
ncbi:MAG: hypothetical protein D3906_00525 [Candidatus Electrothrix sp. AUS1_2]|nr:hypothetical protein [Candidatus Electrothrix sp. AUS1_2]